MPEQLSLDKKFKIFSVKRWKPSEVLLCSFCNRNVYFEHSILVHKCKVQFGYYFLFPKSRISVWVQIEFMDE